MKTVAWRKWLSKLPNDRPNKTGRWPVFTARRQPLGYRPSKQFLHDAACGEHFLGAAVDRPLGFGVQAQGVIDRGSEVRDGDRPIGDFGAELVALPDDSAGFYPAAAEG